MTDPRTLPCGHNFCWECINNLAAVQRSRSASLQCPNNCHQTIRINFENVKDLPRNFTLCSIIESMNQAKRCESHDDYVGFINMTDGKLFCEYCLKNEQKMTHPVAQADPSATPSTTVTISSLSLPPEILTLSTAEDVVKSNLESFIVQSESLVAEMKSQETQFHDRLEASEESKKHAKRQIDSIFYSFTSTLSKQQARLKSLVDGMGGDIDTYKSAASLSDAIVTISKAAQDTSVVLNAQRGQAVRTAQEKLLPFLTSAIRLQSSFASDLDAASKVLNVAKNLNAIKRPYILVTCPTISSLLATLGSPDIFKLTWADDITPKYTQKMPGAYDTEDIQ